MSPILKLLLASTAVPGTHSATVLRGSGGPHGAPVVLDAEPISFSEGHFAAYSAKHGRAYSKGSEEWGMRYAVYMKRVAQVEALNSRPGRTWTAGLNAFGDSTDAELKTMLGLKYDKRESAIRVARSRREPEADVAVVDECADSAEKNCVKDWSAELTSLFVRDQGACGSCWAVSASTVLDARSELNGTNRMFSAQHIVDCVPNPNKCGGSGGCDGATVELAFMYALKKGLGCPETYGAYTATDGQCTFTATNASSPSIASLTGFQMDTTAHEAASGDVGLSYGLTGWQRLPTNKYAPLMRAVQDGPVAISLAADSLFMYESGIFDDCSSFVVNHAVTLIGYGKEGDTNFWLVQNSWGDFWGENGKIRILRSKSEDTKCGMDDEPQDGIACEGETDPVEVCGTCGILFDSIVPMFDKTKVSGSDELC